MSQSFLPLSHIWRDLSIQFFPVSNFSGVQNIQLVPLLNAPRAMERLGFAIAMLTQPV